MSFLDLSDAKRAVFERRRYEEEKSAAIAKAQVLPPAKRRALTPDSASALLGSGGGSGFRAASAGRLFADWSRWSRSADQCLQYSNRVLRARARSLEQNGGIAETFLLMLRQNVVGDSGIRLDPRPPMQRGDGINESVAQQIREAWEDFLEPENFTASGQIGHVEYVNLLVTALARDGEDFTRIVYDKKFKYGMALDQLDADQVDDWRWEVGRPDGSSVRMGIEVDKWRRPLFYHCWQDHPSEIGASSAQVLKVPADQMLHTYIRHRAKQTRGYTWFAPVMVDVKHLDSFVEAAEVAARVGATQMAVVEQDDAGDYDGDGENEDGTVRLDLEPGTIGVLPPGATLNSFNPTYPNISFAEFVKQCLRFVAGGLGVAYHNLGNDLSGVNFSSARAGTIAERDSWKSLQGLLIKKFYRPLYLRWLHCQLLGGCLSHLPYDMERYSKIIWHPRRWEWVDPLKDVQAKALELQNGFTTREEIAAERGKDFLQLVLQLVREKNILEENGLSLGTDIKGDEDISAVDTEDEDPPEEKKSHTNPAKAQSPPRKPKSKKK